MLLHVLVNAPGFFLGEEEVRFCVEEFGLVSVELLEVIVIELVHQELAEFQDAHASVDRLHQFDGSLVHANGR